MHHNVPTASPVVPIKFYDAADQPASQLFPQYPSSTPNLIIWGQSRFPPYALTADKEVPAGRLQGQLWRSYSR